MRRTRPRPTPNGLQPREVTRETRDRCSRVIAAFSARLPPDQTETLRKVVNAHGDSKPVFKRDLERALGILGTHERHLP